ncbi:MAG: ABC transporter substrate-binding protein [Eubacteriales bacterium]|nr:ABC transporter substrate-binding protein [Eubacteriales bacterium]
MLKKSILIIITIAALLLLLTACRSATGFLEKDAEESPELAVSTEISIPMEKIRTLNPVIARDEEAYYLNKLIYQGLFELDADLNAIGQLAESYRYEEDGVSVSVSLKNGIKWQDGTAFSAEDVKFSIEAYLSVYNVAEKSMYAPYVDLIKGVKVVDDKEVLITFKDPKNAAIENLTFPILPLTTAKKAIQVQKLKTGFKAIGTGAYMVESTEGDKLIKLVGNPYYKGSVPKNSFLVRYIPDKADAVNLFDIRQYNMTFLKEGDRDALLSDIDATVSSFPSNEVEVLGFNFRKPALADKKVRQAVACGIDAKEIIESCYYGNGIINDTIYFPNYLGIASNKPVNPYDPDKAKLLLAEAGVTELSLELLVNADNSERVLAAKTIKESLQKVGIEVVLNSVPAAEYKSKLAGGSFDLYLGGYRIKDTYDLRPLLRSYSNPIGYSNTLLDNLLDKMQSPITKEDKKETFEGIRKVLRQDTPYYCLLYKTYGIVASDDLKGDVTPQFFDIYNGCETWNLTYEVSTAEETNS